MSSIVRSLVLVVLGTAACSTAAPTEPLPSAGGTAGTTSHAGTSAGGAAGVAASAGHGGTAGSGVAGQAGGAAAGSGSGQATFAAVASIMNQECGKPLCHGGGAPAQGLNFTDMATLRTTLTTKVVTECNNEKLVVPGDPANSALLKLPKWECNDPVAGPFVMPQGCIDDQCLPDNELATFTAWIQAGAPP